MILNDMTVKLAGAAGLGVDSNGPGLAKALTRAGLHVFGVYDFMSRIRGGNNFYQLRISEHPLTSHNDAVHLLLAFDADSVPTYIHEVVPGGAVIFDEGLKVDTRLIKNQGAQVFSMPLVKIAEEVGGNRIMQNSAALGTTAAITGFDMEYIIDVMKKNFGSKKGVAIAEANVRVAQAAYDLAKDRYAGDFQWKIQARPDKQRMLINGNQAIGMGAVAAGCRFMSAYPMTPATSIFEYMVAHAHKFNVVTKQMEDEIAAVTMAVGASYAGARSMTATSGGGLCLMVEAIGLAGMGEVPLVVVDAMRPGPSTGMPTRTDQGDLMFAINASHGDFPKIVLAAGTPEECFELAARAFNLADKYQCPVLLLTDLFQAFAIRTVDPENFRFDQVTIDRGEMLTKEELDQLTERYARFKVTESGISPRAVPGHQNAIYLTPSDEHTEYGEFDSETAENRLKMVAKRSAKLESTRAEMQGPKLFGPEKADMTFVTWGTSLGAVRETIDILTRQGVRANVLHFTDMWPFPVEKALAAFENVKYMVTVEANISAQFTRLLRMEIGRDADFTILRVDGRPFTPEFILDKLEEVKIDARRQAV